ncbi:unnamed protein product [Ilex paraguariensis]|uniref:Uncharacterized protein n=1 Tax=Ilex paraguariensis TaxID=185542 RepID=A0ABC8TVD9_9AQUA
MRENKDEFWEKSKSLKRSAEQGSFDYESCMSRVKRKRGNGKSEDSLEGGNSLSLGQQGTGRFSFRQSFEERKKGCVFLPGDAISRPLPFSKNPWVESVVTRITDLGDKNVDKSQGGGLRRRHLDRARLAPIPNESFEVVSGDHDHGEHDGFELINFRMAFVDAICSKNITRTNHFIARLGKLAFQLYLLLPASLLTLLRL